MEGTLKAIINQEDDSLEPAIHIPESEYLDYSTLPRSERLRQIWAVGGGKGGVGKSLVTSNLAISLARTGNKVIAVDLDLGGANLHTTLGIELPNISLSDFIQGRVSSLDQCIIQTGISNLQVISGAQDSVNITQLSLADKNHLIRSLRLLDADYLVFDLGAGTSYNTVDFFLAADVGFITLLPEPTSIENGYRFIKSSYYRYLLHSKDLAEIRPLLEIALDPKNQNGIKSPADLFREVTRTNPEAAIKLKRHIEKYRPKLIINQVRTQTDIDIGNSVKTITKKYFGIEMDYIGHLDYDSSVWQAVRRKKPLMIEFPNSTISSGIEHIAQVVVREFMNLRK